jgi:ribosomal protein S18 acetylase RimI-like enzyme
MENQNLIKEFSGYFIRKLQMNDSSEIFTFLKDCDDFSLLVEGRPYRPSDSLNLLMECPPGIALDQKHVLGIFDPNKELIRLIDLVKGYPEEFIWFLGLILLAPDYRKNGLGTKLIEHVEKGIRKIGAKEIRLGVVEENTAAIHFWKRNKYKLLEIRPPAKYGFKEHRVYVFQKKMDNNPAHR